VEKFQKFIVLVPGLLESSQSETDGKTQMEFENKRKSFRELLGMPVPEIAPRRRREEELRHLEGICFGN
jgi:hypothetical protein